MKIQQKIPAGWKVGTLGAFLSKMEGGGTPSKANPDYWNGSIPWASVKDVVTHNPNDTQDHISELGLKSSSSRLVSKGTLIVPTRMALGNVVIFNVDVAINQDLKALYPTNELINKYLFYWLKSKKEFIKRLGSGSTVSGIQQNDLKAIKFDVPPIQEQKRIVQVLETWDKYLSLVNKLIKIKTKNRKYLVEQLTTGKLRINGYSQTWETKSFGEIFKVVTDFVANGSFASLREHVKYLKTGNAILIRTKDFNSNFDSKDFIYIDENAYNYLRKSQIFPGDIIISNVGTVGTIFKAPDLSIKMSLGPNSILVKTVQSKEYIYQFLKSNYGQYLLSTITSTTAQPKFNKTDFKALKISVPSDEEQNLIAEILIISDREIKILEKQRKIISEQKKYLLNNLIAGQIRLPEFVK